MTISTLLNAEALAIGSLSAFCWWRSAVAHVPHPHATSDGIFMDGSVCVAGADFFATAKSQSRWNTAAAVFAAMTALCQVAALLAVPAAN
jgi:hypothetical protein